MWVFGRRFVADYMYESHFMFSSLKKKMLWKAFIVADDQSIESFTEITKYLNWIAFCC